MTDSSELCPRCEKPAATHCVCAWTTRFSPRTEVLVLQHPQEPDKLLGSACLVALSLENARVHVGLSWPSLSRALGRDVDPKRWAVLYLGSLRQPLTAAQQARPFVLLDRQGIECDPRRAELEGVVVLDGTWSQAKTLWWRNAWLLRLHRVILHPVEPSAYGRMRDEPRRECLSTAEAVAETLDGLGEDPAIKTHLRSLFRRLIQRARDAQHSVSDKPVARRRPRARMR